MSQKDLHNSESQSKLKELAESIDFAMLTTNLGKPPFHAVPMSTKKVDESGNIWFLSGKDSTHNSHIESDGKVFLTYAKPGSMQFLSVFGEASITTEKAVLDELYGATDGLWFDGRDDPNLTAIKIAPTDAHYWDNKHNKLITIFKFGAGLVSGDQPDLTVSGELDV